MSNGSERYDRDSRSSRDRDDNNDLILTVRVLMHGKVSLTLVRSISCTDLILNMIF